MVYGLQCIYSVSLQTSRCRWLAVDILGTMRALRVGRSLQPLSTFFIHLYAMQLVLQHKDMQNRAMLIPFSEIDAYDLLK